ncbi:MAG: LysM peptidoglycan-binding domain-containing protein [Candidatus Omnitrophica bacterium]|nr:LysM peptidoglycan-binding domain-containing protein [Candidatus Omnitrophota bacterium]
MKTQDKFYLLVLSFIFILSGCIVRTYSVTKERTDQDSAGNRGYVEGEVPATEVKREKRTRNTRVVEIELFSPIRFERMPAQPKAEKIKQPVVKDEDKALWGNRGFITESQPPVVEPEIKKYTVQKGDTLQKISEKFYGTTKKWSKIYEANKGVLKGTDKIYPGQVIEIPLDTLTPPEVKPGGKKIK